MCPSVCLPPGHLKPSLTIHMLYAQLNDLQIFSASLYDNSVSFVWIGMALATKHIIGNVSKETEVIKAINFTVDGFVVTKQLEHFGNKGVWVYP